MLRCSALKRITALLTLIAFLFTLPSTSFAGPFDYLLGGGSSTQTPTKSAGSGTKPSANTNPNYGQEAGVPSGPLTSASGYGGGNEYQSAYGSNFWGSQPALRAYESHVTDSLGNNYAIYGDDSSPADEFITVMKNSALSVTTLFSGNMQVNYMVIRNGYEYVASGSFTSNGFNPFKYNYQMTPSDNSVEFYFFDDNWNTLKHMSFSPMNAVAFDIHKGTPNMQWQAFTQKYSASASASLSDFKLDGVVVNNRSFVGNVRIDYTLKDANGNIVGTDTKTISSKYEQHLGFNSKNFLLDANKKYKMTMKATILDNDLLIGGTNIINIGTKEITFDFNTPPTALDITGQDLYGYQGADLSYTYTVTDPADYVTIYSLNANPPAGLNTSISADGRSLIISGRPANPGESTLQITALDLQANRQVLKTFTAKIVQVPALTTAGISAPKGQALSKQLEATGGFGPLSFSLDSQNSNLLASKGLSMSSTGLITGTPSSGGTFSLTVTIKDQRGYTKTQAISFDIRDPLTIPEVPVSFLMSGRSFQYQMTATGGASNYQWTMAPGDSQKLSDLGITFNLASGLFRSDSVKAVSALQSVKVTVMVRDAQNNQAFREVTLNVAPEITIANTAITLLAGQSNNIQLSAEGGYGNYTWAAQDTSWSSFWRRYGIQISADGKITGTPQQAINESANIIITDEKGYSVTRTFSFKTVAKPVVTSSNVFVMDSYGNSITNPMQTVTSFKNKFSFSVHSSVSVEWGISVNDVAVDAGTKDNAFAYDKTFEWSTPGTYTVKFWAINQAGRTEVEKTITVLAAPAPQISFTNASFTQENNYFKTDVNFAITGLGEISGDAVLEIRDSFGQIFTRTAALQPNATAVTFAGLTLDPSSYTYGLRITQKIGNLIAKLTYITGIFHTPPIIRITSPANGATINDPVNLESSVLFIGTMKNVKYYLGDVLVGQASSSPYRVQLNPANYAGGTYTLKAVAENEAGKTSEAVLTNIQIKNDTAPPTLSWVSHKNDDVVWNDIFLKVDARDDVAMDRVEFFIGGVLIGTARPTANSNFYGVTLRTQQYADGSHEISAVAYDKKGRASEAQKITLRISNDQVAPNEFQVSWPYADGMKLTITDTSSPILAQIRAYAVDNSGKAKIKLFIDGKFETEVLHTQGYLSWSTLKFDLTKLTAGTHTLSIYAEDASGNKTASKERTLEIITYPNDKNPPQISMVSPSEGAVIKGAITVKANISDDDSGVASVRFYYWHAAANSWSTLTNDITSPPYEAGWSTVGLREGASKIKVEAFDKAGRRSELITNVTIDNNPFDNATPAITSLESLGDGTSVRINFSTLAQAQNYNIQISQSSTFTPSNSSNDWNITTSASPHLQTSLTPNVTYYVRIRALAADGAASEWSTVSNFRLTPDPFVASKPAVISSVTDLNTGDSAKVQLTALSGATSYQVEVSENANFFPATPLETTNLQPTFTGLKNGVTLYVRYRGIKNSLYSQFSDTKTFTIINPFTQKQTAITEVKDLDGGNIEVSYAAIEGAERYEIQIYTNSSFTGTPAFGASATATKATFSGIQRNVQYYVRVRGIKGTANSQWASRGFKLPPTFDPFVNLKTAITSVQDLNTGKKAQINFNAITGANSYEIEIFTNSGMTGTPTLKLIASGSPVTNDSFDLQANTPYYVRVRGVKGTNVFSLWSDTANFTLAAPPVDPFQATADALKTSISKIPNITNIKMTVTNGVAYFEITRRATRFGELEKIMFDYDERGINFGTAQGHFAKIQPTGILPVPGQTIQLDWRRLQLLMQAIPNAIAKNESKVHVLGIPPGLWNILYGEVRVSYDGRHYAQPQNTVSYTLHNYTVNTTFYFPSADRDRLNSPLMAAYLTPHNPNNNFAGPATLQDLNREADAIALAMGNDYSVSYPFDPDSSTHGFQELSSFLRTAYTTYSIKLKDASKIEKGGMQEMEWASSGAPNLQQELPLRTGSLVKIIYRGYYDDQLMTISYIPLQGFHPWTLQQAITEHLKQKKGIASPAYIDIIKFLSSITAKKLEKLPNPDPVTSAGWPNLYRFTFRDTDGKNYRIDSLGANSFTAYRDYGEDTEDYKRALQKQLDEIFGTGNDQQIVSTSGTWNNPVFTISIQAKINPAGSNKVSYQYNMDTKTMVRGTGSFSGFDGRQVTLTGADFDLLYDGLNLGTQTGAALNTFKFPAAAMLKMTNLNELHIKNIGGSIPGIYSIVIDGKYYSVIKVNSEVTFQPDVPLTGHIYQMQMLDKIQSWYQKLNPTGPLRFFATAEQVSPSNPLYVLYRIHSLNTSTGAVTRDILEIGVPFFILMTDRTAYDPYYYDKNYDWYTENQSALPQDIDSLSFKFTISGKTFTVTGQTAALIYKSSYQYALSPYEKIASLINMQVTNFNPTSSLDFKINIASGSYPLSQNYSISAAQANLAVDTSDAFRTLKASIAEALGPDFSISTLFGIDPQNSFITNYRKGKNFVKVVSRAPNVPGMLAYLELEFTVGSGGQINLLNAPSSGWNPGQIYFYGPQFNSSLVNFGGGGTSAAQLFWQGLTLAPFSAATPLEKLRIIKNLRYDSAVVSSHDLYFYYTNPQTGVKRRYRFLRGTSYPFTITVT